MTKLEKWSNKKQDKAGIKIGLPDLVKGPNGGIAQYIIVALFKFYNSTYNIFT